jgi:hypothetical protein
METTLRLGGCGDGHFRDAPRSLVKWTRFMTSLSQLFKMLPDGGVRLPQILYG